jgi:gliding motility-associated-like protein
VETPPTLLIPTTQPEACVGQPLQVQFANDPTVNYNWSGPNGFTSNVGPLILNPVVPGSYSVTATSANGCTNIGSLTATIADTDVNLGPDQTVCANLGSVILTPTFTNANYSNGVFSWSTGGNQSSEVVPVSTPGQSQTISLIYAYGPNCIAGDTVVIKTAPGISVELSTNPEFIWGVSDSLCQGTAIVYHANVVTSSTSPYTLTWTWNGAPATGAIKDSIKVNATELGLNTMKVVASTVDNCIAEDELFVNTRECFAIPNIFTPNGDGLNDFFEIFYEKGSITIEDMKIYARWGQTVYDNDNSANKWDGKVGGKDAPIDVYVYKIKLRRPDGSPDFRSGEVNLIR